MTPTAPPDVRRGVSLPSMLCLLALAAVALLVVACSDEAEGKTPVCEDAGGPVGGSSAAGGYVAYSPAFRPGSKDCFSPTQPSPSDGSGGQGGAPATGGMSAGGTTSAGSGGSDTAGSGGSDTAGSGGSDTAGSGGAAGSGDAGAAGAGGT